MSIPLRPLSHALGRRETIKFAGIAAVGALIAPLTGCSGSALAFKKFAAGTWTCVDPRDSYDSATDTVTVNEDGTWVAQASLSGGSPQSSSGTWSLSGGTLTITENESDESLFMTGPQSGALSSVPDEVDEAKIPSSLSWTYGDESNDDSTVQASWDKDSKTLTLISTVSGESKSYSIIAKKQ